MGARFIYRNKSDPRFYDASRGEMRGGPDKVIVYVNGVLCAMDREARITVPVSRWKLAKIGVACFWAALRSEGAASRSPEAASVPEPSRETFHPAVPLFEPLPEAEQQESDEVRWERLMQEMRDLSR